MSRLPLSMRRPRRARWSPWRRTVLLEVVIAAAVALVVVFTIGGY